LIAQKSLEKCFFSRLLGVKIRKRIGLTPKWYEYSCKKNNYFEKNESLKNILAKIEKNSG
jgi:hypothetical protein